MKHSWEEKNCTKWASDYIKTNLFSPSPSELSNLSPYIEDTKVLNNIEIAGVSDLNGNATITHSRGKVRYLYEFTVELSVSVYSDAREEPYKAIFKVEDCINDQLDDIVASAVWTGETPPSG